jgi:hypothetical protein
MNNNYKEDLLSSDPGVVCQACFELGKAKDTSAVRNLLTQISNPRITHKVNFKGMSAYQCKIGALRKISGIETKSNYNVDTAIINIYLDWAVNQKFIKSRAEVNIAFDN